MSKRIFVSVTREHNLTPRRRDLKRALMARIEAAGFEPQEFLESGIPANLPWSFEHVDQVMRRCLGAIVLGFPRWDFADTKFVNEYNHYEAAVAVTHGLPLLILAERGVAKRGVLSPGGGKPITLMPRDVSADWLASVNFTKRWNAWLREIEYRRDVFLGYCSKSAGIAAQIQLQLQRHGVSVLNWAMDFHAGSTILTEVERARSRCTCGIFLFSEDDPLEGPKGGAAPRDNVVFEAGYFMSSKGPDRCLIIRAGEAKMPADVQGLINLPLKEDRDVSALEGPLRRFLDSNL